MNINIGTSILLKLFQNVKTVLNMKYTNYHERANIKFKFGSITLQF